jgi:hypothetical protein
MSKKHLALPNRVLVCREYAQLWQEFFQFFQDNLTDIEITDAMEQDFEGLIGVLALNNYKFQELCGEYMKDAGEVVKILGEVGNLDNLKNLPEASFSKLQVGWHTCYIDMNRALGKMLARMNPRELAALQQADANAAAG